MGIGRGTRIQLWIPILMIILNHQKVHAQYEDQQSQYEDQQSQYEDQQSQYVDQQPFSSEEQQVQQTRDYFTTLAPTSPVSMIPALRTTMVINAGNSAHNHRVCSTWGNFHFKTFDGDIFQFPGLCNYVFASHCKSSYEDFNVQIRRSVVKNVTVISHVVLKLDGVAVELTSSSITVNGEPVQLPYNHLGVLMERISGYLKVQGKIGVTLLWNEDDCLLLELNEKYANQTCGLCGDFNQIATYNEFFSNNIQLTPLQFGNMQKMDGPTEQCEDPVPLPGGQCSQKSTTLCQNILTGHAFEACNALVDVRDYIDACIQDLCQCDQSVTEVCVCNTFAEYSRQCSHAGGQPLEWRTEDFCPKSCPFNMQHRECGSPCFDTCTNSEQSQLCEDHCIDGCFCPPGTVFDDINNSGCIPISDCYCTYNGDSYAPGTSFSSQCISCSCTGGQWTCISLSCPGICSIEGGSHISTFDEKYYSFFGDCSYMFTKLCDSNAFAVLGEIQKCGLTETETCLKGLAINIDGGQTVIVIKSNGAVYVNMILTQQPMSASNVTIFSPTSFFTVVDTKFGIQLVIQFIPIMQLFIYIDPSHKGQTCGLCGNFNGIQTDDFKAISGVTEGTPAAFANTWKTQADCPNVKNVFENPCTLSIENEKYASHWCGLLTDTKGPFQKCHSVVNPAVYHTNCMFDTCNCEKSEDCMCAALSAYVRACAAKGVLLNAWRTTVCAKFQICPETWTYHYNIETCQATCRALSEVDVICKIKFPPLDGCTCEEGTYLDDSGKCVPASKCPCYHKGSAIPSGEVIHDNGIMCTCVQGKLQCIGEVKPQTDCDAPMVYFNCDNATANAHGVECQKSCQTLDMGCYSAQCASGCVCPDQLVSDGTGKCIPAEECPCIHNEATYKPGETIKDKCNTCTCKNRKWICSNKPCLETCSVYGDGHYITFDDKRYAFNGVCEYTLVQNQCKNKTNVDTFRIITENIPCGSTGTTCSKAIKVFAGNYELVLTDGKFEVIQRLLGGGKVPFKIRYMGIYMVIEIFNGDVIVIWDKKTTVFIKLRADFKGEVCGLCGNYDGNDINDFTTRSQSVVGDVLEFGNSWKVSPTCPDVPSTRDPCSANPYRSSWAQRQCSIINSKTFALCHPQVEPTKYYEACVSDACACDTGGDCECFCTAVAAYAQACQEAGACISWRTPSICPLFCDYYNKKGECEWHYQPCGSSCMKTCRNPYNCSLELYDLEGCYPKCPDDKPYFNEDEMDCVSLDKCGCFDDKGNYYKPGEKLPSEKSCQSCYCSMDSEEDCRYDENECYCIYEGKISKPGEIIYNTTDGIGGCITAICSQNGTIERNIFPCSTTPTSIPTTTVFVFTNTTSSASTTSVPMTTSVCVQEVCNWSAWYDGMQPGSGKNDGDFETFDNLRAKGYQVCKTPKAVECRAEKFPNTPLTTLGQKVECSRTVGLICNNLDQHPDICHNYQIKILCCSFVPCGNYTTAPIPETTTVSPVQTTTVPATILTSTTAFTSTIKGTTKILTTTPETTVLPTSTTIPSTMETGSSTTEMTKTTCKPICKWTEWYDVHFPTLDNEGDFETYDIIKATGKDICENPEHIECRAEKFPNKTIDEIGQKVQCNVSFGFVCRNEDQLGMLQICFNYQIKVYCCNNECLTTPTETSTRVTTPQTTSTVITTTSGTTNPNITTPQRTSTPVPETTTITLPPATTKYTTMLPTISTTKFSTTTTTIHPSSTTAPLTTTFLPTTSEPTRVTTTIPLPTTTQTQIPTTIFTTGILCSEEKCEWSQWYDISYPGNGLDDGDFETFENIRDKGHEVCKAPNNVECQALKYPNASLEELNQNVTCNTKVGLICYNKDQETQICNNYKIRIQCCKMISVPCQTTPISKITTTSLKTTKIPTSILTTTKQVTKTTEKQIFTQYHTTKRPSTAPQIVETTSFPTTATLRTSHPVTTTIPFRTPTREVITTTGPPTTTVITTTRTTTKPATPAITTTVSPPTAPIGTRTAIPTTTKLPTTRSTTKKTTHTTTTTVISPTTPIVTTTALPTTTQLPTTSSTTKKTTPTITTKVISPTTPIVTTTALPTTTQLPTPTTTLTTTAPPTTTCAPVTCQWSEWFDVVFPTSGPEGGDLETYSNIRAAGGRFCEKPINIQCRAVNHPDLSIEQVGQVVQCNVTAGLICYNKDQTGKTKMCYNYEISVLCCEENPECKKTTVPPTSTVITTTSSTTKETTPRITTTVISPTTPIGTTTALPTTTQLPTPTTTLSTTAPPTTTCVPVTCQWSEWFDVVFPTSGPEGGDLETYSNIRAAGGRFCEKPINIQCEAVNHPDLSIEQLGQVVQCDVTVGLICHNKDQTGKTKQCFNFRVRVLCCEENPECKKTTLPPTSTVITTTSSTTKETTPTITTTVISPTTPIGTTTALPTTTQLPTPTTTLTTSAPPTTTCAPVTCQWSEWLDVDFPISGPEGGDLETYSNIRAAGGRFCEKPTKIQCRAVNHPDLSIEQVGQVIQCDVTVGLICYNKDQTGKNKMCYNYEIRVLCCEENPECKKTTVPPTSTVITTTSSTTKETTPRIMTTVISPTTPIGTTTALPTTTQLPTPTTTLSTTAPPTTTCAPVTCQWSEWFDVVFPTSGPEGGDLETYSNIRAAGGRFCEKPINIQCEAVNHPDLSIEQLGQVVQCDVTVGLICHNKDQTGKTKQCFNFRVRVLCCEENPECKKTTLPPTSTVITTTSSTTKETTPTITTTVISPTTPIGTTTALPTTTQLPTPTTTLTTSAPPTTTCAPVTCQWSEWLDVDFPISGPEGGDLETYSNIRAAGGRFCEKPTKIQCRAVNHPDLSIEQVGQVVQCDVTVGLICYNKDQTGKNKMCYNYEIRVLCCEENPECKKTTVPPTSTVITTTSSTTKETTPRITTTVISPTTPIGTTTALPTTTQLPTPTTTLSTTAPPTTTCAPVTCQWSEWFDVVFPTSGPEGGDLETYSNIRAAGGRFCEKPINIQCEAVNHPDLSIEQLGQVVQCDVTVGLICHNKDQTGKTKQCFNFRVRVLCCEENPECKKTTLPPTSTVITTTSSTTKETTPTITTTVISPTTPIGTTTALPTTTQLPTPTTTLTTSAPPTTTCAPVTCQWSEWLDVDFPISGPEGGDLETYSNIRAAGGRFCEKPINIQCRAVNHPDLSIEQVGQVVQCDVTVGLICYNKDQTGKNKMCYNYEIRVLCCEENPECKKTTVPPTSTVITTTSSTTKETTPRITTTVISPTTPIGTTTALPTTTQLPTPTTTLSTTAPPTTTCAPVTCQWSEWFDVVFPTSGPEGGDLETYSNIRAAGGRFCEKPINIQCEAVNHPDLSIEQLGQVVQCDVTVGLICHNKDQTGKTKQCFNFRVRVLCCEENPECKKTTLPPTSTVITTTSSTTKETTPTITTTVIPPTTPIGSTTALPTTTQLPTQTTTLTTTVPPTTTCAPVTCQWSEWFDVVFPTSGPEGGDLETYSNIRAAGGRFCEKPINIQCRAVNHPDLSIEQLGQVVQCDVTVGLICHNKDQTGKTKMCYNYEISVLCCEENPECKKTTVPPTSTVKTTTSSTTKETTPTIMTTVISPTTPIGTTTALPTTTQLPTPTTTLTTTAPPTTTCAPVTCQWSEWLDVDFPISGPEGGDLETYSNIRAAGGRFCEKPVKIQCRAVNHPDLSIEQVGQVVQCDVTVGLICYNKDQTGKNKMCYNYEIRVLCCEENPECKKTTVPPTSTVITTTSSTTKETTPRITTTVISPTTPIITPTALPTTTQLPTPTTTLTTTAPPTTTCAPVTCQWSEWFDVVFPTSGPEGGDLETYSNIRAAGGRFCEKPINIQCRAVNHPDLSIEQVGQVVQCDVTAGLICYNKDQTGKTKMCYNYEISVLCCEENPECKKTTVPPTSTVKTTTSSTTKETTPTIMTTVISPTTPIGTTTALPTTTQLPTPTTTLTTTAPPTTTCAPVTCQWSEWLDVDFPISGPEGGDLETYSNIRAAGGRFCEKPVKIQCRAVNHPDLSIEQVGQVVQCDVTVGLICYNKDQTGKNKMCYNYEIRVLCCEENPECKKTTVPPTSTVITTTSSTTKETTPRITTTVISPTTPIITPTALPTTTQLPTPTTTLTTTAPPTTTCAPVTCQWSEWFDVVFPTSGPEGGDLETYSNIRAAGGRFCEKPINIQCRAVNHPDLSIEQVGQVVQCDVTAGLICYNKDQTGKTKMCYNYEISVLCCEENPECKKTTVPPTSTVITTTSSTTKETTPRITTTVISPTTPIGTTTALPTTTQLPTPTTTLTTTAPPTTTCAPVTCQWSEWLDVDFPISGPEGGDLETYSNIRAAGGRFCEKPVKIQCRAVNHPDLSIEQVGQVIQCDVTVGLICYNKDQTGKNKMCYNYEIRVLCCEENPECKKTTVPPTSTVITTTSSTTKETTPRITTTVISPTTPIVTTTALPTTTQLPTPTTTLTTTAPPTTTCAPVTCQWSEWFDVVFPTSGPEGGDLETYSNIRAAGGRFCEKPINIQCRAVNHPDLSIEQVGQVVQCDVTAGLICYNKDQTGKTKMCYNYEISVLCCEENPECKKTTVPPTSTVITTTSSTTKETTPRITMTVISPTTPIGTTTALPTTTQLPTPTTTLTTTAPPTTTCAPVTCQWSEWLDVDFPISGPEGGDLETYSNIRAAGGRFCEKPVKIQCRAVNHPDLSIEQVGQVVQCDVTVGLICYNKDQTGKNKMCYNYEIRVLCCEENPECKKTTVPPTSTVITTTSSTTKETTPRITTTVISPTTPIVTTTALPTTTQLPTPTTTLTTTAPPTTTCAPVTCQWSEWFDVVFPTSGPEGGDLETYSNIRAAGGRFCEKPINIQCRAVNHPDLSIEQVGQVVQCDVTVGLICYNKDQTGKTKMCYNYEIRVLCCEENPECKKTTVPPTSTVITTTSSTTKETTPRITTTVISPTTPIGTTTALPTTTQLPTPTTTLSTTAPPTTTCAPVTCQWSEWFDVVFPTSGPEGGDLETYSNIRAAGGRFCEKPINIQCEAVNHPDLSIEQLGQVVQCDVTVGLICYNKDQTGKTKQCFNFRVRVLCCEENPECKTTTLPPTTTSSSTLPGSTMTQEVITTTVPQPTSSITSSTTTIGSSTSHCFCQIGENIYMPGEVIYKQTDSDGCLYFAICDSTCSIERYKGPCVSTTTKPTSTPTIVSTTPTTSTAGTTLPPGCPDAVPPREEGETWIQNCTKATCLGNNNIVISKVECPPVQKIICENGYAPVKVLSKDGCCYHYECECICSGWGDPHFITFDGVYYTFQDNCTYVLVQQIIPKYNNFKILIDNYYCDTEDQLSCPQSIIIHYKSSVIVLTHQHFNGIDVNKIYFNGKLIKTSFQKDGIYIYTIGIDMVVEISEIETIVTYSGTIFSVKLPFSKFYNNTEGQCGTCTNNIKDECRLPNGEVTDCPHMAPHWRVPDPKKNYCFGPTPSVPTEITPLPEICSSAPLCSLILNDIFSECHEIIPPDPYFRGCIFDACHMKNISMQCSGLEIYASLCASKGVCIDWRGKTNDKCPFSCPTDKVYEPCGPINPPTCDNSGPPQTGITEGCFCKNGTKLFSTHRDICVSDCGCTGPDGLPKVPGETWISNCQKCICEEYSLMVQCIEEPCPTKATPVECSFEGFVPITILTPEEKCCPQKQCVCNTSHCPGSVETCPLGYELKKENLPGDCCINTTCVKVPGCVVDGKFYSPGAVIPRGLCESCKCSEKEDLENNVECVSKTCDQRCPLGYKYQEVSGQCCGQCVQIACVLTLGSSPTQVIKPGEIWYPPGNNCTSYECDLVDNQYITVTIKKTCLQWDANCPPEYVKPAEDGCCKKCERPKIEFCAPINITKTIKYNGCESSSPIEVTYCEGQCDSFSKYSYKANMMDHTCTCCQEQKTTKKQVTLICPDGLTMDYSYLYVDTCECVKSECNIWPTPAPQELSSFPPQQQEQQQQQQEEEQLDQQQKKKQ